MKTFYVLVVEDDLSYREQLIQTLKLGSRELVGQGVELDIVCAANQEEADEALKNAPEYGFDLIILDLKYPRTGSDVDIDCHGLNWLPQLRRAQTNAAIVVMSSYGYEEFLAVVVRALREGKADEFIPKNAPWEEMRDRIRWALEYAPRGTGVRLAARTASHPMRSQVVYPAAEDILRAAQCARIRLVEVAGELASKEGSASHGVAAAAIRGELDALDFKLTSIAARLALPRAEDTKPLNCGLLARDLGNLFRLQLAGRDGSVEISLESDDLTAVSYEDDLSVALREVLQNAVLAGLQVKSRPPAISVSVMRQAEYVRITVSDSGSGFPAVVVDHMFEQGNSHWPGGDSSQHAGMGLHIARRMMLSIGGDILAENADGHARVTLLVRDWAKP
jgi:DNA-binding NarL/FixJ family response regulator